MLKQILKTLSGRTSGKNTGNEAEIRDLLNEAVNFHNRGDLATAGKLYEQILSRQPDHPYALNLSGILLSQRGHTDEAIERIKHAISSKPDESFLNNLGVIYLQTGAYTKAIEIFKKLVESNPSSGTAYYNLGNACYQSGQFNLAIDMYHKNLELDSGHIDTIYNLGNSYREIGDFNSAADYFQRVLGRNPEHSLAANNLARVYESQGKIDQAIEQYRFALSLDSGFREAHSNLLYCLNYSTVADDRIYREHLTWQERHGNCRHKISHSSNDMHKDSRLRIGYVSSDFRSHSVAFFMEPVLREHDRGRFEIFIYYNFNHNDTVTDSLKKLVESDHWIDTYDLNDDELVNCIHSDGIDILVDLNGHTGHNRLGVFSCKPAPVQVTYLGYPNTTGLAAMDYRLTDAVADPPGETDNINSEELIRIPGCFLCYQVPANAPDTAPLPALKSGKITFGCFNNSSKITRELVHTWSEILSSIPDSVLILKSHQFSDANVINSYLSWFNESGIPSGRVEFISHIPDFKSHLKLYNRIDIALDTYPYNGTTTTCEALLMGVPVVTLAGNTHRSRVGASILAAGGLNELVAGSTAEYREIVKSLCNDGKKLAGLRENLRKKITGSPLTDAGEFTRKLETIYASLRERFVDNCNNGVQKPDHHESGIGTGWLDLKIAGNVHITVPDNINLMTPYILLEQEDWFENEIHFVRKFIQPGMNCIDIGANYGVYTFSMASLMNNDGHIWSFEPASNIKPFFENSIRINKYNNITFNQNALSDMPGVAYLSISDNSELNRVIKEKSGNAEKIRITTLDECMDEYNWNSIDFIKLDAEGQEMNILNGGVRLLETTSPLIMFEIKQDDEMNLDLVGWFSESGYDCYRLIPGLNIIVPVIDIENMDESQLNLFCCSPDRAEKLEKKGLLVAREVNTDNLDISEESADEWLAHVANLPYGVANMDTWKNTGVPDRKYRLALNYYSRSRYAEPAIAYHCLLEACHLLEELNNEKSNVCYLQSHARILSELGLQMKCLVVLERLLNAFYRDKQDLTGEPFICVSPVFEKIAPGEKLLNWCLASILEQTEKKRAYSSYFTGENSLQFMQLFEKTGFNTPEMERRRQLLDMRAGRQDQPRNAPVFSDKNGEHLNRNFWVTF